MGDGIIEAIVIGAVSVIVLAVLLISIKLENRRFGITLYRLRDDKIKKPLLLAVMADLHDYSYGRDGDGILRALKKLKPDLVISAGDMVTASEASHHSGRTLELLGRICENFPFIYGCGNHEHRLMRHAGKNEAEWRAFENNLEKIHAGLAEKVPERADDILPLDNGVKILSDHGIRIYGLNLEKEYFRRGSVNLPEAAHISELVGEPEEGSYNILIGHNPDLLPSYSKWGADLVLSGHVHGGMIATPRGRGLISPRFVLFPRYYRGLYEMGKTKMILSGGLGNHSVHVRLFNRAELLVIRLCPSR